MPATNALAYCFDMSVRERKGYNKHTEWSYLHCYVLLPSLMLDHNILPATNALAYCLDMSVRERKGYNETQSGVTYIATIYKYLDHNSMPATNALA